jgi:hypothetical protein
MLTIYNNSPSKTRLFETHRYAQAHVTSGGLIHTQQIGKDLPRRLGDSERIERMLRVFKLRSTASEIPATLSGVIQREKEVFQHTTPFLPL